MLDYQNKDWRNRGNLLIVLSLCSNTASKANSSTKRIETYDRGHLLSRADFFKGQFHYKKD